MEYKKAMIKLKYLILKNASFKDFDAFLEELAQNDNITNQQYNFIVEIAQESAKI